MTPVEYARAQSFGDPFIASVADAVIEFAVEQASVALDPQAWGARYQEALAVYALHLIASSGAGPGGGGGGAVTSERVGAWAKSYATVTATTAGDAWLMRTTYGQRYIAIRSSRVARLPRVIG